MENHSANNNKLLLTISEILNYINKKCTEQEWELIEQKIENNELNRAMIDGALLLAETEDLTRETLNKIFGEISNATGLGKSEEPVYSLEELLEMFAPVEHYEYMVEDVERAVASMHPNIKLQKPHNDHNYCHAITFELEQPAPKGLHLLIENNQEDVVAEINFKPSTTKLEVLVKDFPPGRYYWKLVKADQFLEMGRFFIHKQLMPNPD